MAAVDFDPDNPHSQHTLRALAEEAARAGGRVARRYFGSELGVWLKSDRSEVSDADEDAQAAVIATIRAQRPQDAFIAEEQLTLTDPPPAPTADQVCWVIDPIDGTRNFVRHIPLYTCSVAAMLNGMPLVGAIYDAQRNTLYSASQKGGLFFNCEHRPRHDENEAPPRGANPKPVVAIPSSPVGETVPLAHAWLDRYVCRSFGSTALHLAMVANGELDAALCDNPRLWDIAAGWVLIEAAGAHITKPDGSPVFPLDITQYHGEDIPCVAATRRVQREVLQV